MPSEESNNSRPAPQRNPVAAKEEHIRGPQPQSTGPARTPSIGAPVLEPHHYRAMRARRAAAEAAARPQVQAAAVMPSPGLDARAQARTDRLARMRAMVPDQTVRVNPRDDNMRKLLRHPLRGRGFPSTGSVEWPLDTFTRRRLRDGDVTLA
jgi:hypothetical protein